ncbi:bifunctional alpha/beta hydrolase/class I SAM-dependent methyltransferase [Pseudomonas sp. F1_0610]|uniref:bifunctional alpha/beta hydrolase/class I SAM-dependent methyltransferase n=1 Tax=Pseudomonas sp. F1_0610 TaxID=3114284 RepID=UPI0039C476F0
MSHRQAIEQRFTTSDQQEIFYRCWEAQEKAEQKQVIVLFHRGHEHSARMQHIVDELELAQVRFYAWDARGHGNTSGERGYSPSLARSVLDVDEFIKHVAQDAGVEVSDIVVIAQSVGAVLVATWAHDYAPKIRGMILASPAFKVKLYAPFARSGLALWQKLKGPFFVQSYVKGKHLTHDYERARSYDNDPLVSRQISSNILLDLYSTSERVVADAHAITIPTQLLISGNDYVVARKPQKVFYEGINCPIKEQHVLDGFFHDTLGEIDRHIALEKMRCFIGKLYAAPRYQHDYQYEDVWSKTADQYRWLQAKLPTFCPKKLFFSLQSWMLARFGHISEGLKLGQKVGFDSGESLDYVYRNKPTGSNALGRLVDKNYLNAIGWRGIRQRKVHLEHSIKQALATIREKQLPVTLMDVAAGHGRYVLDVISQEPGIENVLLRDFSQDNATAGQNYIEQRNLQAVARFVQGDAFDEQSLAEVAVKPSVAIVSGLYELFPENHLLQRSLSGIAQAVPKGGILIYTGQPWHPQQELIARVLNSHRGGEPWVMRIRTQGEMDWLVEQAGFTKVQELVDEWGIFTVSMAVKN